MADENSDLISSAEAGEILGVSRFRVNAMVASGVLPGRRNNGKILVDRAAAEQKAAQSLSEGPQGKFANLFLFYAPAGERTQYVAELEADDADSIERARAFQQESVDIVHVIIRHGGGVRGGKAIMNHLGIDCGDCRLPFAPYTESEMRRLGEELDRIGFAK